LLVTVTCGGDKFGTNQLEQARFKERNPVKALASSKDNERGCAGLVGWNGHRWRYAVLHRSELLLHPSAVCDSYNSADFVVGQERGIGKGVSERFVRKAWPIVILMRIG
jgi:hypothetical protein